MTGVQLAEGGISGIFTPLHRVQSVSGVHPASYPVCTGALQYVFTAWRLIKQWIHFMTWYLVKRRDKFTVTFTSVAHLANLSYVDISGISSSKG
jgi:hypothetical protein